MGMYVFGGMSTNSSTPVNDLYEFDMTQRLWTVTEFASEDRPPSRMFHAATISADSMYMYGGISCFQRIQMRSLETGLKEYHMQQDSIEYASGLDDVWAYDFVTKMWLELSPLSVKTRGDCMTADGVTRITAGAAAQGVNWISKLVPLVLALLTLMRL